MERLTPQEVIELTRAFVELQFAVYNWDLWAVAWLGRGGRCSDDCFMDFRTWLISRGARR